MTTRTTVIQYCLLLVLLFPLSGIHAASILVDAGVVDANPGDGQCSRVEAFEAVRIGNAYQGTLNGVIFDDGGTASGTFVVDSSLNHLIDWNITGTAGTQSAGVAK